MFLLGFWGWLWIYFALVLLGVLCLRLWGAGVSLMSSVLGVVGCQLFSCSLDVVWVGLCFELILRLCVRRGVVILCFEFLF